jgi:hypothetical protein
VVYAPPLFVRSAGGAVEGLAHRMQRLLSGMGRELREDPTPRWAAAWLQEAREIDRQILLVDGELSRAEESLRLNPRARSSMRTGMALRSGLDTLEHCSVAIRSLVRSLTELFQEQEVGRGISREDLVSALHALLDEMGRALASFGRLLSAEVSAGGNRAEAELADALARAHDLRARINELLLRETDQAPETWELHGALLKVVDRLLDEIDLQKRVEKRLIVYSVPRATLRQAGRTVLDRLRSRAYAARGRILRQP